MDSTRTLVRRAQAGDREAFDEIAGRFRVRLENQIRSRMGSAVRAMLEPDDVLSETFACAFESIGRVKWTREEPFYRWLASIAEHVIRNASRKRSWKQLRLKRDIPASGTSPGKALERGDRLERLRKALNALSPDHRSALTLVWIEGLRMKDVAERMSRSPEAVKKLVARALVELKRSFGDTESLHLPKRGFRLEDTGDGD